MTATANNTVGSYNVTATASGATAPATFSLTNVSQLVVNNPTDTHVAGETDLREAIALANSIAGANTITFDATVFATPQTIILGGTQLALSNTTGTETITGPAAGVTVSGNHASRVFQVNASVTASISGLTISGGTVTGSGGGRVQQGHGHAHQRHPQRQHRQHQGGGLASISTATLTRLHRQRQHRRGQRWWHRWSYGGTMTLTNCTLSGNTVTGSVGSGGGMWNNGTTTLTNCTVSGNTAPTGWRLRR